MTISSRIAVLMACYNRREKTLECLDALYLQQLPDGIVLDVFLVDDGSSDGTGEAVQQKYSTVNVLQGDGSLYWCGGMRFAWNEASKNDYDAYIWLNDDSILFPDALQILIHAESEILHKEGRAGILVGSCCDSITGQHTYGGRIKRNNHTLLPDQPLIPDSYIKKCDTMNGNLVFVPCDVFKELGNLSHNFTHAFGDTDYGMRANKKKIPIYIAPGYLASCETNKKSRPWIDPNVPLRERWMNLNSPHGLPLGQWYVYVRRHTGWRWPIYFVKPVLRVLFPQVWVQKSINNSNRGS